MLSIDRCRKLLGKKPESSDTDLESLRDQLYMLANLVIDLLPNAKQLSGSSDCNDRHSQVLADFLHPLPIADQEAIEERSAIREFDSEMDRDHAERAAMADYIRARNH